MVQLGPSGNAPVFRCVYHAWTYDLDGKLVAFPTGMPANFDAVAARAAPLSMCKRSRDSSG